MFGLLKNSIPRFCASSSKAKGTFCRSRYSIFPYLKEIFIQNRDQINNQILMSDLQYTNLVANNYTHFRIEDEELRNFMVTNVDFRETDYTPQLVIELCNHLRPIIKYQEVAIFESVFAFTDEMYFLFRDDQLRDLERVYFSLTQSLLIHFKTDFDPLIKNAQINKKPIGDSDVTKKNLDFRGINVPQNQLEVFTYEPLSKIKINFKKLNKSVTLLGISDNSPMGLYELSNHINNNKQKFDAFIMGLPPITKEKIFKKKTLNKISPKDYIDLDLAPQLKAENKITHPYLDYFEKYGEIALFDGVLMDWYRENILSNDKIYALREEERTVYIGGMGLEEPDVLNTIMFSLTMKKDKNFKVVFADIDMVDEASTIAQLTDLESVHNLFEYARQVWLQELIRWGVKVNKSGCLKCTKSHRELPRSLLSILSRGRFNFAIREKFAANKINQAVKKLEGHKTFVGFYPNHMLYGILKQICLLNSEEEITIEGTSQADQNSNKEENLFKQFLKSENQSAKIQSEKAKKEFTEKFSMILSILSLSERKIQFNPHNLENIKNLDQDLFRNMHQKHKNMFNLESFVKKPIKYGDGQCAVPCFAEEILFNSFK